MLETPKSAKTPSTPGISNSCTTSAILENDYSTNFTVVPHLFSRSAASASACSSWSRLINFPDVSLAAMAAEWPPAPSVASMYVPSGFICSHSSTSSSSTGTCGSVPLPTAPHQSFKTEAPATPPDTNPAFEQAAVQTHHRCRAPQAYRACPNFKIVYLAPTLLYLTRKLNTQGCYLFVCKWLILQLVDHPGVVHHLEIVQLPENVHLGLQLRLFPQHPG